MVRNVSNDHLLLHALADDELDAATTLALEQRIAAEPALASDYARILAVKDAMTKLKRPAVSAAFGARIAGLATPEPAVQVKPKWQGQRRIGWPTSEWRAMAASLVLTACLASGVTYTMVGSRDTGSIEDAIVGGHRRSLLAASPIDIASSDRHTVRPWFDTKLGISPPTPDLASLGFPLVGGRVDVVADRPVPSLVYRHKEHLITVVALPAAPGDDKQQAPVATTASGYNIVRWNGPGFAYWAVSDLDAPELGAFVEDLRTK